MSSITHPGAEPPDAQVLEACRIAIKMAWQTSLAAGAIVLVLSMHSGATMLTAALRSVITMGLLGLIGWGIGAILLTGGAQGDAGGEQPENAPAGERQ
jgi:hypothetical protein